MADLLTGINTSKPESTNEGNTSTPAPTLTTNQDSGLGLSNAPASTPAPAPAPSYSSGQDRQVQEDIQAGIERQKNQFEQQQGTMGLVDQGIQEKTAARAKQQFGLQQESMAKTDLGLQQKTAIEAPVVQPTADATETGLALETAEAQTAKIDELSSTAIDVEGKTAEDIQDEIYNRNKEIFVRDKIRADQMSQERYAQKLAQQGFAGSGTSEALQMMLQTTNANGTASGLESLSLANLNRQATDQRKQEADMMSLYTTTVESGNMTEALKLANQMALMDPDNDYWAHIIANPDSMKSIYDPNIQARIVENREGLNKEMAYLDFSVDGVAEGMYPKWKQKWWLDDADLSAERAGAWSSISDADKARIYEEEFGQAMTSDLSDEAKNEIYAKYVFDNKVKNAEIGLIGQTVARNLMADGASEADLEELQENMSYFLGSDESLQTFIIDGMDFEGADLGTEKAKFLFQDWNGEDYDPVTNPRGERDQYNQDMDQMWKSYTDSMAEGDVLLSQANFREAVANANYVEDGGPLSTKEITDSVLKLQDDKGITPMKEALEVAYAKQGVDNFMDLNPGNVEELLADGTITPADLVNEFWEVRDDSRNNWSDVGGLGNKMVSYDSKRYGIEAIKAGTTPSYTVIDGVLYSVSPATSDQNKRKAAFKFSPIGDDAGAEDFDLLVDLTQGDRSGASAHAAIGLGDFNDDGVRIQEESNPIEDTTQFTDTARNLMRF